MKPDLDIQVFHFCRSIVGDGAAGRTPVGAGDEIAVLPPISEG